MSKTEDRKRTEIGMNGKIQTRIDDDKITKTGQDWTGKNEDEQKKAGSFCKELGLIPSETQQEQFLKFYHMLVRKNEVMNLTAITEFNEVLEKHFLDSLSLVRCIDVTRISSMIDLGTGAGFPGIPIKIMFPETEVTLADSLNKRILFLNELIDECRFEKIHTVHARAEDLGRDRKYREQFDAAVSRAVAKLSVLCEYCLPLVRPGGVFVSYKSGNCSDEVKEAEKAIRILGGELEQTVSFVLPESKSGRTLLVIRKVKNTPGKYPRKAGLPAKEPL